MSTTRFAVVANCQARPISRLLGIMNPDWEHQGDVVVHLATPGEERGHRELLAKADIIFAQLVSDGYRVSHITTARLKDEFGDRVLTWPNLFFHGQTTDTFYLTSRSGRIVNPLVAYHSLIVHDHWRRAAPVEQCVAAFRDPGYDSADEIRLRASRSLRQLEMREAETDAKISDYIAEKWRELRLFHVFNHPASVTLLAMARRLSRLAGGLASGIELPERFGEPLGRFRPILPVSHAAALQLTFNQHSKVRGRDINFADDGRPIVGDFRAWRLGEFVEKAYKCYDFDPESVHGARLTPLVSTAH